MMPTPILPTSPTQPEQLPQIVAQHPDPVGEISKLLNENEPIPMCRAIAAIGTLTQSGSVNKALPVLRAVLTHVEGVDLERAPTAPLLSAGVITALSGLARGNPRERAKIEDFAATHLTALRQGATYFYQPKSSSAISHHTEVNNLTFDAMPGLAALVLPRAIRDVSEAESAPRHVQERIAALREPGAEFAREMIQHIQCGSLAFSAVVALVCLHDPQLLETDTPRPDLDLAPFGLAPAASDNNRALQALKSGTILAECLEYSGALNATHDEKEALREVIIAALYRSPSAPGFEAGLLHAVVQNIIQKIYTLSTGESGCTTIYEGEFVAALACQIINDDTGIWNTASRSGKRDALVQTLRDLSSFTANYRSFSFGARATVNPLHQITAVADEFLAQREGASH